jgi:hypothetical protein
VTPVSPLAVAAPPLQTQIPKIEANRRILSFAQTAPGKIAILACAAGLFYARGAFSLGAMAALSAIAFFPAYRWLWMSIAGVLWIPYAMDRAALKAIAARAGIVSPFSFSTSAFVAAGIGAVLGISVIIVFAMRRAPNGVLARNPRLTLLAMFALLLAAALSTPAGLANVTLWAMVFALSACLWFLSYALSDQTREPAWHKAAGFFSLWQISATSTTPFLGRSSALRRLEAKNAEEFAAVQLKGLKLLVWSLLLFIVFATLDVVRTSLGIPTLPEAIDAAASSHPYPCSTCWLSLLAGFEDSWLRMTVWGGAVVGGCRLAGFRLLRNTYRPLQATTIVEFWNRYYYYFKELIADFFFYPVYLRCFKRHPRFRMFFATWVAVGLGIPLFHFIRDIHYVVELGLVRAALGFRVYLCYANLLALGIGISLLRKTSRPRIKAAEAGSFLRRRLIPLAGVMLFFCFLQIFDETRRTVPLREHVLFLTGLFGWKG